MSSEIQIQVGLSGTDLEIESIVQIGSLNTRATSAIQRTPKLIRLLK